MNGPDGAVYIDASAVVKLAVQEHSAMLDRASEACDLPQRTLDAIHLAAAETMRDHLGSFVSYDGEQRQAAEALDWAVHALA